MSRTPNMLAVWAEIGACVLGVGACALTQDAKLHSSALGSEAKSAKETSSRDSGLEEVKQFEAAADYAALVHICSDPDDQYISDVSDAACQAKSAVEALRWEHIDCDELVAEVTRDGSMYDCEPCGETLPKIGQRLVSCNKYQELFAHLDRFVLGSRTMARYSKSRSMVRECPLPPSAS